MPRATVLVLLLTFALNHGAPAEPERDWRIIGGSDAPPGSANYQASINSLLNTHICGGAILNARTIVTAAQRLKRFYIPTNIIVVVGTYTLNSESGDGASYAVSQIKIHPSFDLGKFLSDIALVITRNPIVLGGNVQPIPLSTVFTTGGVSGTITGWGTTSYPGNPTYPNKLQIIKLKTIELQQCKDKLVSILDSHICTLPKVGEGICGDYGNPLVAGGKLIGIVTSGPECALGFPDVYTRISFFISWINDNQVN